MVNHILPPDVKSHQSKIYFKRYLPYLVPDVIMTDFFVSPYLLEFSNECLRLKTCKIKESYIVVHEVIEVVEGKIFFLVNEFVSLVL